MRIQSLHLATRRINGIFRIQKTDSQFNLLKRPVPNEADPQELIYQFSFSESSKAKKDGELWSEVGRILDFDDPEDAEADIKGLIALYR